MASVTISPGTKARSLQHSNQPKGYWIGIYSSDMTCAAYVEEMIQPLGKGGLVSVERLRFVFIPPKMEMAHFPAHQFDKMSRVVWGKIGIFPRRAAHPRSVPAGNQTTAPTFHRTHFHYPVVTSKSEPNGPEMMQI